MSEEELKNKLQSDKTLAGLKLAMPKKEYAANEGNKKKNNNKKKDAKPEGKKAAEETKPAEEDNEDPEKVIVFDQQTRNAFSQLKMEPPAANKDINSTLDELEKRKTDLDQKVKAKEAEIQNLRKLADANVPSVDELKEKFKDLPPRERDEEKGTHGHKDRRDDRRDDRRGARGGARGGRSGGNDKGERSDVQWKGLRTERHPRRQGDEEKADIQEQQQEQEDSFEEQSRKREKERRVPTQKGNLAESDFPKL